MTLPYAHCKGILMGTMTMELGGKVSIECAKTGYAADLEFKLRVRIFSNDLLFYSLVSRRKGWDMETRLCRFFEGRISKYIFILSIILYRAVLL